MTVVIGTAGHIDHGKTTLLRALTGIDADRLPEERERGMTIDVGYAHLDLPDGTALDFVDVPGHDRLVGNMLVGAGEVDAALVVVAADDGPRAQTLEHLELLDALGVVEAVAAITKIDLVEADRVAAVRAQLAQLLERTTLAGAPIVAVSGRTGAGVDELREALLALRDRRQPDRTDGARLWVDRAFAVRGRGAVVTGTLRGSVARGDVLRVLPLGRDVRVREVQVHGQVVERSRGGRTALNLASIEAGRLRRGDVLVTPGSSVRAADRLLVALREPAALGRSGVELPPDRAHVRFHVGTDHVDGRVSRSGRESAELPDGRRTALLRLGRPVAVADGDPFVLRRPSPGATAAAGVVIDADPPRGASRRRVTADRLAALAVAKTDDHRRAARRNLHGVLASTPPELAADIEVDLRRVATEAVRAAHLQSPASDGPTVTEVRAGLAVALRRSVAVPAAAAADAARHVLDGLVSDGILVRRGERVADPGHQPAARSPAVAAGQARLVTLLNTAAPPPLREAARRAGCPPEAIEALERAGRIVKVDDDLAWSAEAWERLAVIALDLARRAPLAPAAFRDATGTSRKYVMALLEDLDRRGILTRTPTGHVSGPRAATLRSREPVA